MRPAFKNSEYDAPSGPALLKDAATATSALIATRVTNGLSIARTTAPAATTPDDLEARYRLAAHQARSRDYAAAIAHLLAIVERDRAFRDDGARKTLLALFDALGADDPLVVQGRRKLANLLF